MILINLTETTLQKKCADNLLKKLSHNKATPSTRGICLVCGDLRKIQHLFLFPFAKKIIVVDDGMISLSIINSTKKLEWLSNNLKRFLIKGILKTNSAKISYYTIFANTSFSNSNLKLTFYPNNITAEKIRSVEKKKTLVIGMDLVECSILTRENYIQLLEGIIAKEGRIDYFPHRKEKEKIQSSKITMIERSMNIEDYLITKTSYTRIISFYSTSLVLINYLGLNNTEIFTLKIPESMILKHHAVINNSYKYISEIGIQNYTYNNN